MYYMSQLHDYIAVVSTVTVHTVSCKLASKPLFSGTSAAKPTVEAVLDLEVNDISIIAVLLCYVHCIMHLSTCEFPYGEVGGFSNH